MKPNVRSALQGIPARFWFVALSVLPMLMLTPTPSRADNVVSTTWITAPGAIFNSTPVDEFVEMALDYSNDTTTVTPSDLGNDLLREFQMISRVDTTPVNLQTGTSASVTKGS